MNKAQKAAMLEKQKRELADISQQSAVLQAEYEEEINQDPKYSLIVDPENKYDMPKPQKDFVKYYVEYKSIGAASEMAGISIEAGLDYFKAYSSQQEIRRINLAMCHRQFQTKLMSIDEVGGWLTSLLTEDNIAVVDRPKLADKLRIAQMIIDLNKYKVNVLQNPALIMGKDIETDIRELSLDTIRAMIATSENPDRKNMENLDMTLEEKAYIETLPTKELLTFLDENAREAKHVPESSGSGSDSDN